MNQMLNPIPSPSDKGEEIVIAIKFSPAQRTELQHLADEEGRKPSNYIRRMMQQYLVNLDYTSLPDAPPSSVRTTGHRKGKQQHCLTLRIPRSLKEEFYRVAELQGHKGASLIKRMIHAAYQTQFSDLQES